MGLKWGFTEYDLTAACLTKCNVLFSSHNWNGGEASNAADVVVRLAVDTGHPWLNASSRVRHSKDTRKFPWYLYCARSKKWLASTEHTPNLRNPPQQCFSLCFFLRPRCLGPSLWSFCTIAVFSICHHHDELHGRWRGFSSQSLSFGASTATATNAANATNGSTSHGIAASVSATAHDAAGTSDATASPSRRRRRLFQQSNKCSYYHDSIADDEHEQQQPQQQQYSSARIYASWYYHACVAAATSSKVAMASMHGML